MNPRPSLPLDRELAAAVRRRTTGRLVQRAYRTSGIAVGDLYADAGDAVAADQLDVPAEVEVIGRDETGAHGPKAGEAVWVNVVVRDGRLDTQAFWLRQYQITTSAAEASKLFAGAASLTFTSNDQQYTIPFDYPHAGCSARAHVMANAWADEGYSSGKIFAVANETPLEVPTDLGPDVVPGVTPGVSWEYHVAPVVLTETRQRIVIDPSVCDGPTTVEDWLAAIGAAAFEERSFWDLSEHALPETDYYYFAPASQYFPVGSPKNQEGKGADELFESGDWGRDALAENARRVPVYRLAKQARAILNDSTTSQDEKLDRLQRAMEQTSLTEWPKFPKQFPHLFAQMKEATGAKGAGLLTFWFQ